MAKKKTKPQRLDLSDVTPTSPDKPQYSFGDTSKETNNGVNEEKILDEILKESHLVRKNIPKDGACMFRAVADQIYYSQAMHLLARLKCVDYMVKHRHQYEPFVCVSGMPFDHYCYEMRKKNSWGGQAELHALSQVYRVNFIVYSAHSKEPTRIDNGLPKTVTLCYYGNHYDSVILEKGYENEKFCQSIVYSILDKALKNPLKKLSDYKYKNIGWEWWLHDLKAQQEHDQLLAQQMADTEDADYKGLSGYYKKPNMNGNDNEWKTMNRNNKNKAAAKQVKYQVKQSPNGNAKNKDEEDLSEALAQIAMMQERERKLKERDPTEFPSLPPTKPKTQPVPTTPKVETPAPVPTETAPTPQAEAIQPPSDAQTTPVTNGTPATPVTTATPATPSTGEAKPAEGEKTEAKPPVKAWGKPVNWQKHLTTPKQQQAPQPAPASAENSVKSPDSAPEAPQATPEIPQQNGHHPPSQTKPQETQKPVQKEQPTTPMTKVPVENSTKTQSHEAKPTSQPQNKETAEAVKLPAHVLQKIGDISLDADDIAFGDFGAPSKPAQQNGTPKQAPKPSQQPQAQPNVPQQTPGSPTNHGPNSPQQVYGVPPPQFYYPPYPYPPGAPYGMPQGNPYPPQYYVPYPYVQPVMYMPPQNGHPPPQNYPPPNSQYSPKHKPKDQTNK